MAFPLAMAGGLIGVVLGPVLGFPWWGDALFAVLGFVLGALSVELFMPGDGPTL